MPLESHDLFQWVGQQLSQHVDIDMPETLVLTPLSGDAGARQYYRVNTQPALLAVMAPSSSGRSESAEYFAQLSSYLLSRGIYTPKILGCDKTANFLLIECFDGGDLYDHLTEASVDGLYSEALLALLKWQQTPSSEVTLPLYDTDLLNREMRLFPEWFVGTLLGYSLSADEKQLINTTFAELTEAALAQPQVLVHRDYHSRNLIYRGDKPLGIIDFQDAVIGPITYDLVSILRDCYIRWSPEQVRRWAIGYGNIAYEAGLLPAVSTEQFITWFDMMGLQRHLKVLGIFARLYLRDNKPRYLHDLPLVIRYVLEISRQYPSLQTFAHWFEEALLPIIEQQAWYTDYRRAGDQR